MKAIEAAVIGVVSKDPELKQSKAGKAWLPFSIGVDNGEEDADGKPVLEWVKILAFGETAERLAATVHKGDRVYAEGALKVERWTDKEGAARTALSISAFKIEKVGAGAIGRNRTKPQPADEDLF